MYQQIELWGEKNEKMKEKSKSFHCKADRQGRLSPCLVCSVCPCVSLSAFIYYFSIFFSYFFSFFLRLVAVFFAKKPLEQRSLAGLCNVNCKLAIDRERERGSEMQDVKMPTNRTGLFIFFFLFWLCQFWGLTLEFKLRLLLLLCPLHLQLRLLNNQKIKINNNETIRNEMISNRK